MKSGTGKQATTKFAPIAVQGLDPDILSNHQTIATQSEQEAA